MGIKIVRNGDIVDAYIEGKFTFDLNKEFRSLIDLVDEEAIKRVTVHCSAVSYIDSAGLGMLLLLRDAAKQRESLLELCAPSETLQPIFRATRFYDMFTII